MACGSQNGAVIRKHMGYEHIESRHAEAIEAFYERHFNPYLNFHRPCGVPEVVTNAKGKQRRIYRWYATPWEILRQTPDMARYLRPGMMRTELERQASAESDTEAAAGCRKPSRCCLADSAEKDRMKTAVEMTAMDAEENQQQVSLRAHSPWKSQTARFPHSHRRDEAMEKWKTKNRFPTFHCLRFAFYDQIRKEAWRRSFAPSPGSLFD